MEVRSEVTKLKELGVMPNHDDSVEDIVVENSKEL
ncbi:hypothetical protein Flavo103_39890 [Flavobacterium collinsii]|nr:hypothetical protein Flavo103_39890 [Flavobacterium collinsii]